MYHSITFGDKNTWDDWHLIPETQPVVSMPTQKTNYIDIPGASGSLDLSESLTGYPLFNDREGSFTFILTNNVGVSQPYENRKKIHRVVEDIAEHLHGKVMRMRLEDDSNYYYEGRFSVSDPSPEEGFSKVTINYRVGPYKWSIFSSVESNWMWDTFNFNTDTIYDGVYSNIQLNANVTKTITIPGSILGTAPIQPLFYLQKNVSGSGWNINMSCNNKAYNSGDIGSSSNYVNDDFVSTGNDLIIYATSTSGGLLSINFRPGRL